MSLMTLKLNEEHAKIIRDVVQKMLHGSISAGPIDVLVPESITLTVARKDDHTLVEWSPPLEADLPGPNPDLMRAKVYATEAVIDLRLSDIRITYA